MKVYFAGSLFTHKDLAGNAMLSDEIGRVSGGKFECLLPQNIEHRGSSPKEMIEDRRFEEVSKSCQRLPKAAKYWGSRRFLPRGKV